MEEHTINTVLSITQHHHIQILLREGLQPNLTFFNVEVSTISSTQQVE